MLKPSLITIYFGILLASCGGDSEAQGGTGETALGATVVGSLTLPAVADNKPFEVRVLSTLNNPLTSTVASTSGRTGTAATLDYSIANAPAGTYFVLGFVDVDESGGDASTPGDYAGWFGHDGDGDPPGSPNAVVPTDGSVRFDFSLVQR
jgi:hypothetical protein